MPFESFRREPVIPGSFINPSTEAAIALAAHGVVKLAPLISHQFQRTDLQDVMSAYGMPGVSKAIVTTD